MDICVSPQQSDAHTFFYFNTVVYTYGFQSENRIVVIQLSPTQLTADSEEVRFFSFTTHVLLLGVVGVCALFYVSEVCLVENDVVAVF
jgi:hypothetical protein